MRLLIIALIAVFGFCSAENSESLTADFADSEIRCIICRIDKGDYAGAQNDLNKILQKDSQNIYAQRLLPSTFLRQIVKNDKSTENIARIRKAVEAYDHYLKNPQIPLAERLQANGVIIDLYEKISPEEKTSELLKRAADKNLSAPERGDFYTKLTVQPYKCAGEMTDGKTTLAQPEIEKTAACIAKGLEYVNQAITLDADSVSAWSYKAGLSIMAVKIAGFENNQAQKDQTQKERDEAVKQFKLLNSKRIEKEQAENDQEMAQNDKETAAERKKADLEMASQELIHYKYEKPLDKVVTSVYIPFPEDFLPELSPDEMPAGITADQKVPPNTNDQKHEWKTISTNDGELTMELPDNVQLDNEETLSSYEAGSQNVGYKIFVYPKTSGQTKNLDDSVLNILAWKWVILDSHFIHKVENVYEANLLRKLTYGDQPGRLYALTAGVCACQKNSVLLVLIGKKSNYTIDIYGANEQSEQVKHFLKSLKFN